MTMHIHTFNNVSVRHEGKEYLVYAKVHYTLENDPDVGLEAVFESAEIDEAIGFSGKVQDKTLLASLELPLLSVLNNDSHIARTVGSKHGKKKP